MKKFITTTTFVALGLIAAAQTGSISGSVKTENAKTLEAATISLLNSKDSSLIKTTFTGVDGRYRFDNVKAGSYLIAATSVGLSTAYGKTILVDSLSGDLPGGDLRLSPLNKEMSAVVVKSKKLFVERKVDKTIINPEALISNAGTSVMEVLEKSPGVSVDKDGNISLVGKQGVIVMIDGKPSYMTGVDLANFLRNMPSANLEIIELMTNPSAKYDAAGNSGIINIKTKKNKQKGFNGSANLAYGQGVYAKTNNSLMLNYKTGKINIFSTFSGNYRKSFQELDISRIYINEDKSVRYNFSQNTDEVRENQNYNAKIGMDFYATKKTTLGIVFTGYTTPSGKSGNSLSYPRNNSGILDSIVTARTIEDASWKNGAVNFNVLHNFDSTGKQITFDFDILQYRSENEQQFDNVIYNADRTPRYRDRLVGELPSSIKIYAAKTDYSQPLKKGLNMEAGLKFSYVTTDNRAGYFNIVNNEKLMDIQKTNHFEYKENINAAYINFNKEIKKWSFQTGLRVENTNYDGHQFGNPFRPEMDSVFSRSYTNAFPTAYISYKASAKNQLSLSAGRRINRPDYEDLNPFMFFLDKYTYEEGNPFLRPTYSNTFELSHTYNQFLTTTVNYSHSRDLVNEVFRQSSQPNDSVSTIVSTGNFGSAHNLSVATSAQIKVTKKITSMVYGEARYQQFTGDLYNEKINNSAVTYLLNINNQFSFKKGWSAELSGFFRSRAVEGQMVIQSLSQMDLGVKKDILKNKGSLKLAVRDVYGPMRVKGNIDFQTTRASFQQSRDSRVATLSFSYRFGKPIKGLQKRKTGGAGDEQNRIKSGN